jgi:hypothetical protein
VWFAGVRSDVGGSCPDPALAEFALLWMAERARECGLVLQADAFPASPANATQAPQDRMALLHPNPPGTLRQSGTAFYRLLPRLIRRPGAKDPDHEYVADNAVDRHHRGRRYAPTGLIEYLDAGGPVIPSHRPGTGQHQPTAAEARRDRVNKPALVQSETTMGRMR